MMRLGGYSTCRLVKDNIISRMLSAPKPDDDPTCKFVVNPMQSTCVTQGQMTANQDEENTTKEIYGERCEHRSPWTPVAVQRTKSSADEIPENLPKGRLHSRGKRCPEIDQNLHLKISKLMSVISVPI